MHGQEQNGSTSVGQQPDGAGMAQLQIASRSCRDILNGVCKAGCRTTRADPLTPASLPRGVSGVETQSCLLPAELCYL